MAMSGGSGATPGPSELDGGTAESGGCAVGSSGGRSERRRARSCVRKQKHHACDTEEDAAHDDHPVTRSDSGNAKEDSRDKEEQPAEPTGA